MDTEELATINLPRTQDAWLLQPMRYPEMTVDMLLLARREPLDMETLPLGALRWVEELTALDVQEFGNDFQRCLKDMESAENKRHAAWSADIVYGHLQRSAMKLEDALYLISEKTGSP